MLICFYDLTLQMEIASISTGIRYYVMAVTPRRLYSFTGIGSLEVSFSIDYSVSLDTFPLSLMSSFALCSLFSLLFSLCICCCILLEWMALCSQGARPSLRFTYTWRNKKRGVTVTSLNDDSWGGERFWHVTKNSVIDIFRRRRILLGGRIML